VKDLGMFWAEWHTNPELPRIPWRTLTVLPEAERESPEEFCARLDATMTGRDAEHMEAMRDRRWPRRAAARRERERRELAS
jgi:hypothetical protein